MSALDIVRNILTDDAGVSAIAGNRVWPIVQDQTGALPGLVLTLVSEDDGRHLGGSNGYPLASIIVNCLGKDFLEADRLGDAVKGALRDFHGVVGGTEVSDIATTPVDHFDRGERGDQWRRRIGFEVRYRQEW